MWLGEILSLCVAYLLCLTLPVQCLVEFAYLFSFVVFNILDQNFDKSLILIRIHAMINEYDKKFHLKTHANFCLCPPTIFYCILVSNHNSMC